MPPHIIQLQTAKTELICFSNTCCTDYILIAAGFLDHPHTPAVVHCKSKSLPSCFQTLCCVDSVLLSFRGSQAGQPETFFVLKNAVEKRGVCHGLMVMSQVWTLFSALGTDVCGLLVMRSPSPQ